MALIDKLTAIANAIRSKTKKTGTLTLDEMPTEILSIQTGSSDVPFEWGGVNAEKVSEYTHTWTLSDTSFVINSSSSTTATSILATTSNYYTNTTGSPTYAYGDSDIIVVQKGYVKPTHSGSTGKTEQISYGIVYVSYISKRKTTDTSAKTTRQVNTYSAYINKYFNSSAVATRAVANYGFYMTPQAPTVASATSASTYVRVSSPVLSYRASSTYESTANIKKVTDCTFNWKVEVYKVDSFSTIQNTANDDLDDLIINGLN